MKFRDFLLERLTAHVHTNDVKSLFVISSMVEKAFGVENPNQDGICLIAQVISSISATTGAKPQDIVNQIYNQVAGIGVKGITLARLLKLLQTKVTLELDGHRYRLKLSITGYDNIAAVLRAVKSGQPVIVISSNYGIFRDTVDYVEAHPTSTKGIVTLSMIKQLLARHPKPKGSYQFHHALLVIGYDVGERTVILRDIRDEYGYKGYYKIEKTIFEKHWDLIRTAFSVDVDELVKEAKHG